MDINSSKVLTKQFKSFQLRKNIRSFSRRSQRMTTLPVFSGQKQYRQSAISFCNAVQKSVKKAQLKFITGQRWVKLATEPAQQQKSSYFQLAHDQLNTVRKQYDMITFQRKRQDLRVSQLKKELSKFKAIKQKYEKAKNKCIEIAAKMLPQQLQRQLQKKVMESRVLNQMVKTLENDVLHYKQKQEFLDRDLVDIKIQMKALKNLYHSKLQQKDISNKLAIQMQHQIAQDEFLRNDHLGNYQTQLMNKTGAFSHGSFRITQMSKIVANVQQDKTSIEKQWKNIYLTHIFLSKMLTNKINRQMQTFNVVENSYLTIKNMTHVEDINQFVQKFLKKEEVYGQLLGKISQSEQRILKLKQEQEELRKQFQQLSNPTFQIPKYKRTSKRIRQSPNKSQQGLGQQTRIAKYRSKIPVWLNNNIRKLRQSMQKQFPMQLDIKKIDQNYQLKEISQKFINYLQLMKQILDKCELMNLDPMDGELKVDNVPKLSKDSKLNENDSKNQFMLSSYQFKSNKQSTTRQAEQQLDILAIQRQQTIRKNDKFMKELRKQKLQNRRLKLEKNQNKKKMEN